MEKHKRVRIIKDGTESSKHYKVGEEYEIIRMFNYKTVVLVKDKDGYRFALFSPYYDGSIGPECEFIEEPAISQTNHSYSIF